MECKILLTVTYFLLLLLLVTIAASRIYYFSPSHFENSIVRTRLRDDPQAELGAPPR